MKRIGLCLLLLVLAGCSEHVTWFDVTPIHQVVTVHEPAVWVVEGTRSIRVVYGDGVVSYYGADKRYIKIEHLYECAGTYTVEIWHESAFVEAIVEVRTDKPQAFGIIPYQGTFVDPDAPLSFNITGRLIGCDNGTPSSQTGVFPGEGVTEFRFRAYASNGEPIELYDFSQPLGAQRVWGEWLVLKPRKELQVLTAYAGRTTSGQVVSGWMKLILEARNQWMCSDTVGAVWLLRVGEDESCG